MPKLLRDRAHLYLRNNGKPEPYTSKNRLLPNPLPQRERETHADMIRGALTVALEAVEADRRNRDARLFAGTPGFYLDFEIPVGAEQAAELLENRLKHIELVAFRQPDENRPAVATVFVPDSQRDYYLSKIDLYRTENTRSGNPKGRDLVARINSIVKSATQSGFTDDPALFPKDERAIWWEVWLRANQSEAFWTVANRLELEIQQPRLIFPDREVSLLFADVPTMGRLFLNCGSIAELRRAKDNPKQFVNLAHVEQAERATDLIERVMAPVRQDISVCILDTGINRTHPLISPALEIDDLHRYEPTWDLGDSRGHGTNMAGLALYGDLASAVASTQPLELTHRLESVKILPDHGQNDPRLYGAVTRDAVAQAEISAPNRRRAICLAVTSDIGTNRGRPSSWSAAIDQLCFGDENSKRLVFISAGNIRDDISKDNYPARNETEPIENPAQSWNAIAVGAFTEKTAISDPSFAGWQPLAPEGELCPTSRTSITWERQWPIKPDVLMEGGNWATSGDDCDCPDDLGILTTYRDPTVRHFDIFRDTSAATAAASHLAGKIYAAVPERWPETIRALIIHSAEWTPPTKAQFDAAHAEHQKQTLLRKYGYGVANYDRAVLSAANDLTLIAEDEVQPFWKNDGKIKTRHMNLHEFPWPRTELEQMGETEVELRVTLSYYIEPNPGERGWLRRHRYASHALRFAVKRELENLAEFRGRINAAADAEEVGVAPVAGGTDDWFLGRIRNRGSIHSDHWYGSAATLAQKSAVGVYPIGGWWKENLIHKRHDKSVRYALIVSIRATNGEIDIYTPVRNQIAVPITNTT